jgi:hypothetical protein
VSEHPDYVGQVKALVGAAFNLVKDHSGRVRTEEFLSALSAVTGELVLRAVADFDLYSHDFPPGQRVFSAAANQILFNDIADWASVEPTSTFGAIRNLLAGSDPLYWPAACFPDLAMVLRLFAETRPTAESWGCAPLSLPPEHRPRLQPLRAAYQLRPVVFETPLVRDADPKQIVAIGSLATVKALLLTKGSIAPAVALSLVFETINGMAKTAPMTPRHMKQIQDRMGFHGVES